MRNSSLLVMLVAAMALTCSQAQASDTHYRWMDQHGNPVHSDRPPPKGTDYEVVTSGTSLVRKVDSTEGAVPAKSSPTVSNDFEQVDTAKAKSRTKNPEYCHRAQNNLATLNTRARIRMRNDQGETYILTEEDKEDKRAEARRVIELECE